MPEGEWSLASLEGRKSCDGGGGWVRDSQEGARKVPERDSELEIKAGSPAAVS